nr:PilZ domain-containing protein [Enterovirga sp. DB1703]
MAEATSDRAPRLRTLLMARAEFNGGATTVDCTVRDLSESGARLQVPGSAVLPPRFVLFVPKHGRRYDAEIRWQRDGFIGIEFVRDEAEAQGGHQEGERVAKLEAEVARLRRLIEAIRADPSQARLLVERFDLTSHTT